MRMTIGKSDPPVKREEGTLVNTLSRLLQTVLIDTRFSHLLIVGLSLEYY